VVPQQAPVKADTWTDADHEQVIRASGATAAQELREDWEAHRVALFRTDTATMVVEAGKDPDGLLLIVHALAGREGQGLIAWLCDFARQKGISRITADARTASRARLYERWGRHLKSRGLIWAAAVQADRQPTSPTFAKITFSTMRGAGQRPT